MDCPQNPERIEGALQYKTTGWSADMISLSARQILYILLGPLICLTVSNLPAPEGMTQPGMLNLGACLWIVFWWMTEVFPMTVTSIISIPVFAIFGLLAPAKSFSFFGSPSVMLIFGATIIVGVLKESNFMIRYAHYVMNLKFIQGSKARLFILLACCPALRPTYRLSLFLCT